MWLLRSLSVSLGRNSYCTDVSSGPPWARAAASPPTGLVTKTEAIRFFSPRKLKFRLRSGKSQGCLTLVSASQRSIINGLKNSI